MGAPEEIKIKKIKINEWVNRWLSAPEEMEVERREEVEEEGGELVQAVEHLMMILYIIVYINHYLSETRLFCHITIADIRVPIQST